MSPLVRYMKAWVANDPSQIAAAVATECTIAECYGPVYSGRDRVRQWAETWLAAGGIVHGWTITDQFASGSREAAQWEFECTWGGNRSRFEGATVSRSSEGLIVELREFQTTAALYDWHGEWR
ncbi:nuclear transport factor 2 family protein [Isoptericola croceus]|uniref:nuclear transport factor 2 family protein n=1 Tax=Isoptericola croceus TaxID=3031406 RepID=UPI0023F7EAD7|nr:nuclear transport factor 2 family protein [Isoptericola croceus]